MKFQDLHGVKNGVNRKGFFQKRSREMHFYNTPTPLCIHCFSLMKCLLFTFYIFELLSKSKRWSYLDLLMYPFSTGVMMAYDNQLILIDSTFSYEDNNGGLQVYNLITDEITYYSNLTTYAEMKQNGIRMPGVYMTNNTITIFGGYLSEPLRRDNFQQTGSLHDISKHWNLVTGNHSTLFTNGGGECPWCLTLYENVYL